MAPLFAHGSWEGHIAHEPRGAGGFGYDPWFVPHGYDISAAQMSPEQKNQLSHRGQALRALARQLPAWR
jgi:XTP/dITP diphosphohydrolase